MKRVHWKALLLRPQFFALAAVLLINWLLFPGFFDMTWQDGRLFGSLIDVLNRGAPVAILAIGMTAVIATKGVDLSVGAVMAIAGAVAAVLVTGGTSAVVAVAAALAVGVLCGLWNGVLVTYLEIQPIIATLVLMVAGRGLGATGHRRVNRDVFRSGADFHRHGIGSWHADADCDRKRVGDWRDADRAENGAGAADRGGGREPLGCQICGHFQWLAADGGLYLRRLLRGHIGADRGGRHSRCRCQQRRAVAGAGCDSGGGDWRHVAAGRAVFDPDVGGGGVDHSGDEHRHPDFGLLARVQSGGEIRRDHPDFGAASADGWRKACASDSSRKGKPHEPRSTAPCGDDGDLCLGLSCWRSCSFRRCFRRG